MWSSVRHSFSSLRFFIEADPVEDDRPEREVVVRGEVVIEGLAVFWIAVLALPRLCEPRFQYICYLEVRRGRDNDYSCSDSVGILSLSIAE